MYFTNFILAVNSTNGTLKFFLFLFLFFSVNTTFSQFFDKKIKRKVYYSTDYYEKYYVLRDSQNVRHGTSVRHFFYEDKMIEGTYQYGKKQGIFKEYHYNELYRTTHYKNGQKHGKESIINGDIITEQNYLYNQKKGKYTKKWKTGFLIETGYYHEYQPFGIWTFYNYKGQIDLEYDYTTHEITYFTPDTNYFRVKKDTTVVLEKLNRPPLYLGSLWNFYLETVHEINQKIPDSLRTEKNDTIIINFLIDSTGTPHTPEVFYSTNKKQTFFVKNIVKKQLKVYTNWLPPVKNDKPVSAYKKTIFIINRKEVWFVL